MSGLTRPLTWGASVVCGLLLVAAAEGQTTSKIKPAARAKRYGRVHQMEVFDGSRRTVRYFGDNISPGESSTLRDLERAENELNYLNDLQSLKTQYVVSERLLEPYRRLVQRDLYGYESTQSSYGTLSAGYYGGGYGGYGGWGGYYGYPSFGGYGGYGSGVSAVAGDSFTQTRSLANGVGPESRIKEAMAGVLAQQATPEYAAKIDRNYDMAMLRATTSPTLRVAFNVPTTEEAQQERNKFAQASGDVTPRGTVTLTLKDGEKVQGRKLSEKGDWFVLEKADGSQDRIRQSEVTRIQGGRTGGIVPAADR